MEYQPALLAGLLMRSLHVFFVIVLSYNACSVDALPQVRGVTLGRVGHVNFEIASATDLKRAPHIPFRSLQAKKMHDWFTGCIAHYAQMSLKTKILTPSRMAAIRKRCGKHRAHIPEPISEPIQTYASVRTKMRKLSARQRSPSQKILELRKLLKEASKVTLQYIISRLQKHLGFRRPDSHPPACTVPSDLDTSDLAGTPRQKKIARKLLELLQVVDNDIVEKFCDLLENLSKSQDTTHIWIAQ